MASKTTYEVELLYNLKDRTHGLSAIGQRADAAASSVGSLTSAIGALGGLAAGGAMFAGAKRAFIDFNSQVEQSKLQIATVSKLFDKGLSDSTAMRRADEFFTFYQQRARESTGTTQDFISMHTAIMPALAKSKAGIEDMKTITTGAMTAVGAFGENAELAKLDIKQMLAGTVGARDRFAQLILAAQGVEQEAFNAAVKKDASHAVKFLKEAFSSPTLKAAAEKQANTWQGLTSTFQDTAEILMGKAGQPLFKAARQELKAINEWIDRNPQKLEEWGRKFSESLMTGFNVVKGTVGFIIDHKDALMALASMWAVAGRGGGAGGSLGAWAGFLKGPQDVAFESVMPGRMDAAGRYVGGLSPREATAATARNQAAAMAAARRSQILDPLKNASLMGVGAGGVTGFAMAQALGPSFKDIGEGFDSLNRATGALFGAVSALPGPLGLVGQAALATKIALDTFVSWLDDRQKKGIENTGDVATLMASANGIEAGQTGMQASTARAVISNMKDLGVFNADATLNEASLRSVLDAKGVGTFDTQNAVKAARLALETVGYYDTRGMVLGRKMFGPEAPEKTPTTKKADINVTINKIEVASDDPDRFVIGLANAVRNVQRNPTTSSVASKLSGV